MLSFAGQFTETETSKTDIEIRREYQSMYNIILHYKGCKESQFYSLPFELAVASMY